MSIEVRNVTKRFLSASATSPTVQASACSRARWKHAARTITAAQHLDAVIHRHGQDVVIHGSKWRSRFVPA